METQEQEVEAFKRWWHDNGKVVVIGVLGGLAAVVGWNVWQQHVRQQAEMASTQYAEVVNASTAGEHAQALAKSKALLEEFPDSGYAELGALIGARSASLSDAPDEAKGQLMWAITHAQTPPIKDLARLRLARILAAEGDGDKASAQLDQVEDASFAALVAELRGDLAYAKNDQKSAIAAYESALATADIDVNGRQRLTIKLSDLGVKAGTK